MPAFILSSRTKGQWLSQRGPLFDTMFSSRHTPATPSISLERGVSRLRTPRLHNHSTLVSPGHRRRASNANGPMSTETLVWAVLAFLVCAAFFSFGMAYYLVQDSDNVQFLRTGKS